MPFIETFSIVIFPLKKLMEFIDKDYTNSNGVTQLAISHPYLHHHHSQVDQLSMSYIPTPVAHFNSYHHLPTSSLHQSLTTPSRYLCTKKPDKSGGRKRKRSNEDGSSEALNTSDVIHVRAKRGQATDSHSLAERVRRKKINDKLYSLHDIVPGCHKTMGMAVMLDVVFKYIQSLQNQIEFLSMKLLTASLFHNLNTLDSDTAERIQCLTHGATDQEIERLAEEGYGGGAPYFSSSLYPQESFQNQ